MSKENKSKVVTIDHANKHGDRDKLNPNSPLKRSTRHRWQQASRPVAGACRSIDNDPPAPSRRPDARKPGDRNS